MVVVVVVVVVVGVVVVGFGFGKIRSSVTPILWGLVLVSMTHVCLATTLR